MFRRVTVATAFCVCLFSVASFPVSAASASVSAPQHVIAQAAAACADATIVSGLGKDLTDMGTAFKATDMKSVSATAQTFITLAGTRQKYENLKVSSDCLDLQLEAILAFSNASDILVLNLASLTDTANASAYTTAMTDQATRFQNSLTNVSILAGIATAAPGATPVGRISQITSTSCADATFLGGLATDFGTISSSMSSGMSDMTALSKGLLSIAALRQKYEDMVVASGCEITQLNTIVAFANVTDLLGLALAVQADPTNAATYAKVLTAQASRTQQWIQIVLTAVAGPSATMAATAAK